MSALETLAIAPGGGFLFAPVPRSGVFSRESLSEDQVDFGEAARRFTEGEVLANIEGIESGALGSDGKTPLVLELVRKAAELGLASIDVPEEYDGLGLDLTTSLVCSEELFGCASFAATLGAHAGIGTLPIVYFGTDEQKKRYLPDLCSAERISCYSLTEPGNGSDALNGRTTAVLSEDGTHFVLNGQKQFITNGSWGDISVVFANIKGRYSALIVDLHSEGVTRGAEEKKMGIHGSSTCGLTFQDVKVPVADQLGKDGDAAKIALNILYVGRLKLGFGTLGTAKYAIGKTLDFCSSRTQFGRSVIEFDLQQGKLAEACAWTYGCDSACYRVVGEVDSRIHALPEGHTHLDEIEILRQFGLEVAIVKIVGSETLSRVLYHAVRMHGGYGFCTEYQVERLTRDNVVDTIYEGTNDINRIVLSGALVENAFLGAIPFREGLAAIHECLRGETAEPGASGEYLADEELRIARLKRAVGLTAERVLLNVGKDAKNEQQVMVFLTDALTQIYVAESAFARSVQQGEGDAHAEVRADMTRLLIHEAQGVIPGLCRDALMHVEPHAAARSDSLAALDRLLGREEPLHVVAIKRRVAEHFIRTGRYDI